MRCARRRKGWEGEEIAATFLKAQGYYVRERNFRCPLGEIDIVAEEGGEIVFVEVKARSSSAFGFPQESVDMRKQERLRRVASFYLKERKLFGRPCRFDVVGVWLNGRGDVVNLELIRGAF
ncbi:MAG: YraN family protein [Thermanaeromonas sp.]|uniref:YraN family protein n=1 Tax=Thermanaeromonas sp. TaxID=2003697 RepID=UPI00243DEA38|nr:YraN family protein [Thermanaeromonas sp.]MCG0277221.1 YraN family protein [Thermanaeromonas sp.]